MGVRYVCRFDRGRVGVRYELTDAKYMTPELEDHRQSVTLRKATKT